MTSKTDWAPWMAHRSDRPTPTTSGEVVEVGARIVAASEGDAEKWRRLLREVADHTTRCDFGVPRDVIERTTITTAPKPPDPDDCKYQPASSLTCSRGTHSCEVEHRPTTPDRGAAVMLEHLRGWCGLTGNKSDVYEVLDGRRDRDECPIACNTARDMLMELTSPDFVALVGRAGEDKLVCSCSVDEQDEFCERHGRTKRDIGQGRDYARCLLNATQRMRDAFQVRAEKAEAKWSAYRECSCGDMWRPAAGLYGTTEETQCRACVLLATIERLEGERDALCARAEKAEAKIQEMSDAEIATETRAEEAYRILHTRFPFRATTTTVEDAAHDAIRYVDLVVKQAKEQVAEAKKALADLQPKECAHERTETRGDLECCLDCSARRMHVWGDTIAAMATPDVAPASPLPWATLVTENARLKGDVGALMKLVAVCRPRHDRWSDRVAASDVAYNALPQHLKTGEGGS